MAAPRYRNASEMSRVIAHGTYLYACRQDEAVASPAYHAADAKWRAWVGIEGDTLAGKAMALQAHAFDMALCL